MRELKNLNTSEQEGLDYLKAGKNLSVSKQIFYVARVYILHKKMMNYVDETLQNNKIEVN